MNRFLPLRPRNLAHLWLTGLLLLGGSGAANAEASAPLAEASLDAGVAYLQAANARSGSHFGFALSLSADGRTLAVGANGESGGLGGINPARAGKTTKTNDTSAFSGAVYIFGRTEDDGWRQQAYIKSPSAEPWQEFGFSVALSNDGRRLAVGAPFSAGSGDAGAQGSGSVLIYTLAGGEWSQTAALKASRLQAEAQYGFSLAFSGDGETLAVGAVGETVATQRDGRRGPTTRLARYAGAVYLYSRHREGWREQGVVTASNSAAGAFFGRAIALSEDGDTLAVGALGESSNASGINPTTRSVVSAVHSGAAYVFVRTEDNWTEQAFIKASNSRSGDQFGRTVALSADGNTMAVSAIGESGGSRGVDGDQRDRSAEFSGAVYVFNREISQWAQHAYIKGSNARRGDRFGDSLAMNADGTTLAVGAWGDSSDRQGLFAEPAESPMRWAGAAYVFQLEPTGWRETRYIKAPDTAAGAWFGGAGPRGGDGRTVALSSSGETLAIGAPRAAGLDGDHHSGAVYLY
ncbi:hypothetical protein J2T57_002471 [Natronocella acetinitrilica]|uniref:Integrin n=1 Tax=Natronocella acetinitrilica TaxID=414046 RepID=A0AAE3G568_9GAMM|nr:FG-GAP repeat protein [Natronocella acetinitrilica]MCP1675323.1 hypothetical protein [Natronocella acetinitrilica]